MFEGCSKLTYLDLSNFDTFNVKNIRGIFRGCANLQFLNITKCKRAEEMLEGINRTKCNIILGSNFPNYIY
mgnify:CR=1 FL=1